MKRRGYVNVGPESDSGQIYALNNKKWKFKYIRPEEKLYRCKKCEKIFAYSLYNICPELKCDGELEGIEAEEMRSGSYYESLYTGKQFIPTIAREHTAQLSSETARQYQEKFE